MSPLRSASPRLKLINALVPAPDLGPAPDATGTTHTHGEAAPPVTASSRSSSSSSTSSSSSAASSSRGSRRWVFIRDMLLHRSKSEPGSSSSSAHARDAPAPGAGANKPERGWPFSPSWAARDRLAARLRPSSRAPAPPAPDAAAGPGGEDANATRARGQGRGRRRRSTTVAAAHERLYAAPNRAQAEEMRRRTFLPYRQGLLGCLGFSSRGYGALHGLTKTLNPVFSR